MLVKVNILLIYITFIHSSPINETNTTSQTTTVIPKDDPLNELINLNTKLWLYRPLSQVSQLNEQLEPRKFMIRPQRIVTKLAKSYYSVGFDPYFSKDYFEPFEKRSKPVTIVAFRKNGYFPKIIHKPDESKSLEIAELQSPYNHISNLWIDEPET